LLINQSDLRDRLQVVSLIMSLTVSPKTIDRVRPAA
jgi:hypothetical protein